MATNIAELIREKLKVKQVEAGLSDVAFAEKIGISRQLWAFVKSGQREPGKKFLSRIVKVFPDLWPDVMNYLKDDNPVEVKEP